MTLSRNSVKLSSDSLDAATGGADRSRRQFDRESNSTQDFHTRRPFGAEHNTVGGNLGMAFAQMITEQSLSVDPLLTVEDVAERLKVSRDWVWDHSSRKAPYLPVIRMGDGALRYRASKIEAFIDERERLAGLRLRRK